MGKLMYKGQTYSSGGGEMPETYDELTAMLEDGTIEFDSDDETSGTNIRASATLCDSALRLTGYSTVLVESEGNCSVRLAEGYWGDTESEELGDAISDMCNRIATLEQSGGGGLPQSYAGLTSMLENDDIEFNTDSNTIALTGYHMTLDASSGYIVGTLINEGTWGDTDEPELGDAITNICNRVESLEEGGGGEMPAEYDGLTTLIEEGAITFNTDTNPHSIIFDSAATNGSSIVLETNNNSITIDGDDIDRSGYWGYGQHSHSLTGIISDMDEDLYTISDFISMVGNDDISLIYGSGIRFYEGSGSGDFGIQLTGYATMKLSEQADITIDSGYWGDTEDGYLVSAFSSICDRIAALEQSGGGALPASYSGLTYELEQERIAFSSSINPSVYATLALTGYHPTMYFDHESHIISADGWGDTDEDDLFRAIYDMCERIASLEESGIPDSYAGLTDMLEDGNITFNNEFGSPAMAFDNSVIDVSDGDIVKSGYWGDIEISDTSSLINYLSALSSYTTGTQLDVNNLTDTVSSLSDNVDSLESNVYGLADDVSNLSDNIDSVSSDLSDLAGNLEGFTTGYFSFVDSYTLESYGVSIYLDTDADIVNDSGYWGAWEDEQTQESSDGTGDTSLKNAIVYICKKLDELEARIAALES